MMRWYLLIHCILGKLNKLTKRGDREVLANKVELLATLPAIGH
jgi:hypothetical protein